MKKDRLFEATDYCIKQKMGKEETQEYLFERFGEISAPLVLDSTGFTRVTDLKGIPFFLSLVQILRTVGETVFKKHNAINYRFAADNLFAEFSSVDSAVSAAFEIHKYFEDNHYELTGKDDLFGCSIGIGWGPLLRSDYEGVFGDEMNRASKLGEDIAKRGQTFITESAYENISTREELVIEPVNEEISGIKLNYYSISAKQS